MPKIWRVWPEPVSLKCQLERTLLSAANYFTLKKISQLVNFEHRALEPENGITTYKLGYQSSRSGKFLYTGWFCHVLIPGCGFKNQNVYALETPQRCLDNRTHFFPIESSVAAAKGRQSNRLDFVLTDSRRVSATL